MPAGAKAAGDAVTIRGAVGYRSRKPYHPSHRRLAAIYAIPRPMLDEEQFLRFHHHDLPDFEDWQLDTELVAVSRRLYLEPDRWDRVWLLERRAALQDERYRRHGTDPLPPSPTDPESWRDNLERWRERRSA